MFCWRKSEFIAEVLPISSVESCLHLLDRAIQLKDLLGGLGVFSRLSVMPEFGNVTLIDRFSSHVEAGGDTRITVLFDTWRGIASVLGRDTNVVGMLLYLMLGGVLPRIAVPAIGDAMQLMVTPSWGGREAREPPAWANDGIHARGDGPMDRRFAGLLGNFIAMCNAYAYYGRLDPDDPWLPEFFSVRG